MWYQLYLMELIWLTMLHHIHTLISKISKIWKVRFSPLLKVVIQIFTEAAKYMIKVSEDDKLFASYFWWRDFYIANIHNSWSEVHTKDILMITIIIIQTIILKAWCGLCSSLHNKSEPVSVIPDLHKWWATDAKCFKMWFFFSLLFWIIIVVNFWF